MRDPTPRWQKILAQGFNSVGDLLDYLQLPPELASTSAERLFATRVPKRFASLMQPRRADDPLLLQVLASNQEMISPTDYSKDPLAEADANPVAGLIHKYHGRVLLTVTGSCAINCRYCFRRHFPYEGNNPGRHGWYQALAYIAEDPTIEEVILSGGDPLLAPDAVLRDLIQGVVTIPHVKTLRVHSRIPVVLPERIDPGLLSLLAGCELQKVIVLHSNHPTELDVEAKAACHRLREAGCLLLNQSVLLAGVNDDIASLTALSKRLFDCGVLPYYLHVLDKVEGAAHFDVPLARAQSLHLALQANLPGYLVPRLAREEPGHRHKTLVGSQASF